MISENSTSCGPSSFLTVPPDIRATMYGAAAASVSTSSSLLSGTGKSCL